MESNKPLINILIRTHRPHTLPACLQSIQNDTYQNKKIHVYDGSAKEYGEGFKYNLLCNFLKDSITEGWFMFLDDDDVLISGQLDKISEHLNEDEFTICQMKRGHRIKPDDIAMDAKAILRGHIGMPCFLLHSKHKNLAMFVASEDADYRFIKQVSGKLKTNFVKIAIVHSPKRSFGK